MRTCKMTGALLKILPAMMILLLLVSCNRAEKTDQRPAEKAKETPVIKVQAKEDEPETTPVLKSDEEAPVYDADQEFYITKITDEIFSRMEGKSFKADCTLPREDLRYLHVLHKTLEHKTMEGELVVNVHIAEDVLTIFRQLYEADYPIEKIRLVDEYDADDELSMADNNTSCFNFRFVAHTNRVSKHGRGLAIDLNPLYNPYVVTRNGLAEISPENGTAYADRTGEFPYKIDENDLAYRLFTEHGFDWGGAWKNEKDYQHFEIPSSRIKEWYE